ncbi:unnamed protein product [Calicophoron daubneyi]|uniref:F-spondin n=1 Tax=Calicophoron daubneyi TaxID=300641 RepID=A0AAV2TVS6_CALDB
MMPFNCLLSTCLVLSIFLCDSYAFVWRQNAGGFPAHCSSLRTSITIHRGFTSDRGGYIPMTGGMMGSGDDGFELRVRRASDDAMVSGWYDPGKEYVVTLTNKMDMVGFRDAILWLTPAESKEEEFVDDYSLPTTQDRDKAQAQNSVNRADMLTNHELGSWIHRADRKFGTQARYGCYGLTAERYKNEHSFTTRLVVGWRAPLVSSTLSKMGDQGCVAIYAAVRVHGGHDGVYSGSGKLVKQLCPASSRPVGPVLPAYMTANHQRSEENGGIRRGSDEDENIEVSPKDAMHLDTMQPRDCCACGSATYNLTFQGLWTRETHPKDWPVKNPGLLHWTNLIGATHTPAYRIYQMGDTASAGVAAVCAYGDTTVLRQTLGIAAATASTQQTGKGIGPLQSLISTPGMWSEDTLTEPRSTLIGVNRTHPLITFLTMLGPSPNWCTGIASQSVCQSDCTWVKRITMDLFPWDAGVRHGDTYIPKNGDRKDVPDPIRFITADWMPTNPFTPGQPVARITLERVLPRREWECINHFADGVELFRSDGNTEVVGSGEAKREEASKPNSVQSATGGGLSGSIPKKSRGKTGGGAGGVGLAGDNPLADPSLAQMATFLCITENWSTWSRCSVTCGIGKRERHRAMLVNKKAELCQHVPLVESELCEGRKRTCDFSAPCSLLPWTEWAPCNATCTNNRGRQSRKRYLARLTDRNECMHLFRTDQEKAEGILVETRECAKPDSQCDPVTRCGEGRKDGVPCGNKVPSFYYSAADHACLPFDYLGCKGGRNRFQSKDECEKTCLKAVESLPGWRRERMGLLQYQTSQISSDDKSSCPLKRKKPAEHCGDPMDAGVLCNPWDSTQLVRWYFSPRIRRCVEFVYLGCGGNKNRYPNQTQCMSDCLPEEWEKSKQMAKALAATSKGSDSQSGGTDQLNPSDTSARPNSEEEINMADFKRLDNLWGPKQDCVLTTWSGWGPCSVNNIFEVGTQMRWRSIERPARNGGVPCGLLFDERSCRGARR